MQVAKALFDGQLLDVYFTRSFYKHTLGVKVIYHDIEAVDPDYYKNLKWMLEVSGFIYLKVSCLFFLYFLTFVVIMTFCTEIDTETNKCLPPISLYLQPQTHHPN